MEPGDLSDIDELLVFGFVRDISKIVNIPHDITCIIRAYYWSPQIVVIKNGSGNIKAGFGGVRYPLPQNIFPSIVGRLRHPIVMVGMTFKEAYVGTEAKAKRGILTLRYPIEHGIVTDWDSAEKLWHHTMYEELQIQPEDHPVLLTEKPLNPKANREKMAQIMFESFKVPAMYMEVDAVLALYAVQRTTGCVVDMGEGASHSVPVYNGHCLRSSVQRLDIAGRDLTDYFRRILAERGYAFHTRADREIVEDMKLKHKMCYVALDYQQALNVSVQELERNYELPDQQVITIGNERFRAAEPLFRPSLIGFSSMGMSEIVHHSIQKCAKELQKEMYGNILLSGGSSMFDGMEQRLENDLERIAPVNTNVHVLAPENRNCLSWIGGSMLTSTSNFRHMLITKYEYGEYGPSIVLRKCF